MIKNKKQFIGIIAAIGLVFAAALFCVIFLLVNCSEDKPSGVMSVAYPTTARHGYYAENLGKVKRKKPTAMQNGGLAAYPKYGSTLSLTAEQKSAILDEANSLCAKPSKNATGVFDKMDAEGWLYLSDGTPVNDANGEQRRLYKHTASEGMYFGDVDDSEPAVIKRITFAPRAYSNSYSITGLYAPAGEVVKLEMGKTDFEAVGKSVTVHIGQCLYNGQNNNIWTAKNFNRMPVIMSTQVFNEANSTYNDKTDTYTCYIGSFLGGPIYIRNMSKTARITFSGAVNYRHFVLGSTTEKEFDELCKSSAPYFDLEVWDNGVLQSGPLACVKNYSYAELYKAAVLWEKISLVSTNVRGQGIVFLYDPFVAAGAAVAFPGRASVNCPTGWMTNALNCDGIVKSGAWGVMHEYNHNFQGWGLDGGGEVTNNALNIAEYAQFTKISSARTLSSSGESGLSGWNAYTSATRALKYVLAGNYNGTNQLSVYATLIHNIGQKDFVLSAKRSGTDNYYTDLCNNTGLDMTYFFSELINKAPSAAAADAIAQKKYPAFIPISSVYQTGRSITSASGEKRYITTMQPYVIKYGEAFTVDLSEYTSDANGYYTGGSIVIPDGFSYTVKSVGKPEHGSIAKIDGNTYKYSPDPQNLRSGKIPVTLSIIKKDGSFTVNDVELVLEFEQTHENNKNVLERTVYTYKAGELPETARAAYDSGYAGAVFKTDGDSINRVQNSNTDIWEPDPAENAVMEVRGKLYIATDGDYRVALRGRHSAALYLSDDGKNYSFAARLEHNTNANGFFPDDPTTYKDCLNKKAGEWIYFKEVLRIDYASAFVGLGFGRIENEGGTMDEDGNVSGGDGGEVKLAYPTAYRATYEFPTREFDSEYLFTKKLYYSYDGTTRYDEKGTLVALSGYTPWAGYDANAGELFDDDGTNYTHSKKGVDYDISPINPFDMTVDLGSVRKVNTLTVYGSPKPYQPKDFTLYGGTEREGLRVIAEVTDAQVSGGNVTVSFDPCDIRYYRIVCTKTYGSDRAAGERYISFRYINLDYVFKLSGGMLISPLDGSIKYTGGWSIKNAVSEYGRVVSGGKNAKAEFTFTGSRFIVGVRQSADFDVYIDGKYIDRSEKFKGDGGTVVFVSPELKPGEHKVKLVCKSATNLAFIAKWE